MNDSDWEDVATDGGDDWEDVAVPEDSAAKVNRLLGENDSPFTQNARLAVGGLSKIVPFNFGDEIIAGGAAATEMLPGFLGGTGATLSDAYNRQLSDIRGYQQAASEVSPTLSAITDIAGGVAMPLPGNLQGATALKTIGKGAGLGALLGGGYGFGAGEGVSDRLLGAGMGTAMGGALGGVIPASIEGVRKAAPTVKNLLSYLSPEASAARQLAKAGADDILKIQVNPEDALQATRTLAEETQNPKIAQLQNLLGKGSEDANAALVANEAERRAVQNQLLSKLSPEANKTAETGGNELRDIIQGQSDEAFKAASGLYDDINKQGLVPVNELKDKILNTVTNEFQAGGMPESLKSIAGEISETASTNQAKPFSYVKNLRERAQQAWFDAKSAGDAKTARVANQLVGHIDDTIATVPQGAEGALAAQDVTAYRAANKAYAEAAGAYKDGKIGSSLRTIKDKEYITKGSEVIDKYFDGTPEGTRSLIKALPQTPEAQNVARGTIRDHIIEKTSTNDGILAPEKFRTYLRNNREALTAETKDGKRIFDKEHIDILDSIAKDLGYLSGQSKTSVKSLATAASKGEPTTAQTLLMAGGDFLKDLKRIPGIGGLANIRKTAVDRILQKALIEDKSFAKSLVEKATKKSVRDATKYLIPKSVVSGVVAGKMGDDTTSDVLTEQPQGMERSIDEIPLQEALNTTVREAPKVQMASLIDNAMDRAETKMAPKVDIEKPITPLVEAVIKQESGGNPNAESEVGAKGLMQLMDKTGAELAKKANVKYNPKDPEQNKMLGEMYLKQLLSKYDGDVELALTAYHSGPGRVDKLLKKNDGEKLADIIDDLGPIGQKYAKSVLKRVKNTDIFLA